jgi:secreted protein with Ig-like and vWFA domain
MKRIVRLTEGDLVRLVKRVISENLAQMGTSLKKRQDLIGKSFKKDGNTSKIVDAYEILETDYNGGIILKGDIGGSGMIDSVRGFYYIDSEKGSALTSGFNWSTKTNSFEIEPRYKHNHTYIQ